jgi:epoxyqueuosine reductase
VDDDDARLKGSSIKRAKRRGLLRNVTDALGNCNSPEAVAAHAVALNDQEPLVRGHRGVAAS